MPKNTLDINLTFRIFAHVLGFSAIVSVKFGIGLEFRRFENGDKNKQILRANILMEEFRNSMCVHIVTNDFMGVLLTTQNKA